MQTNPVESATEGPPPPPAGATRVRRGRSGAWIAGGIALAGCVAVGVVDPNTTHIFPTCAFKAATGLDCPGCGMTRGLHALLHGDVLRALSHNVLLVVMLATSAVWFGWNAIARRIGKRQLHFEFKRNTWIAIGLAVLAFWVVRNLPWAPFNWLGSGA